MVLLECKLYETLHPETWDWEEICTASGTALMPSESIKVVPPRHNGTELGHRIRSLLTQEELAAVREAGEAWRHHSYTPYHEMGVVLRALAERLGVD
jgi:hypothetical protein